MNDNFTTRMVLSTAVFAAVTALLVGPASAFVMDVEGGGDSDSGSAKAVTPRPNPLYEKGPIPYFSHGIGVDESQSSGQPSVELIGDTALKVDRAVAAANEAYDLYVKQLPAYPAHVDMMNQLRNLTEQNAIKWGWSQGLAHDQASAGKTQSSDVA
jgi:hypothetical protein